MNALQHPLERLGAPRATPGRSRTLWARLAALAPATTFTPPPLPPTASTTSAASTESAWALAARLIETGWLVVLGADGRHQLHHAIPARPHLTELLAHATITGDLVLTCGNTTPLAAIPSALDAHHTARCSDCADAIGYPIGTGAPRNDPRAATVLADRLETLR